MIPEAHGFEPAEDEEGAVEIVDAPAAEPAAVGLLLLEDELDGALDAGVLTAEAVEGEHLEHAAGDVDRSGGSSIAL